MSPQPPNARGTALEERRSGVSQVLLKFVPISCLTFRDMAFPTGPQQRNLIQWMDLFRNVRPLGSFSTIFHFHIGLKSD